jgi:glycosyltransferase involved in cell wall biosynthesis
MKLAWNAIVKNEAKVIERCVRSLLPHIDCAIVVDTGSTDSTPELLMKLFAAAGKPLELRYAPFENFEQARNEALRIARVSPLDWQYLILVDADMELVAKPGWCNGLTGLSYDLLQKAGSVAYWNRRLVSRQAAGWYIGVTHEFLDVESAGKIESAHFVDHYDGSNRSDKYKRDIELLEKALETETRPGLVQRFNFYLGQSYFDAGNWAKAAEHYKIRAGLGGFDEEVWNSQYHYAHCLDNMGNEAGFVREMLRAYEMRPHRAEALYDLAKHFRLRSENFTSLLFSDLGNRVPDAKGDVLFVNKQVPLGLKEEFAICAYYDRSRCQRGAAVCNEVALDLAVNWQSRNQARYNQYWYLQPLTAHVSSFSAKQLDAQVPDGYVAMNPSIANDNGKFVVLVRAVNYTISPGGRYDIRPGDSAAAIGHGAIHTRNFIVPLGDLSAVTELALPSNWPVPKFDLVRGFEDSRLFAWKGRLWTISTVRELTPEGWCEQVLAPLTVTGYGDEWKVILPAERLHEKNWQPWVDRFGSLRFVYRPGVLVDVDGKVIAKHDCKWDVGHFSGGSQVVNIDESSALAVVHEARFIPGSTDRYYAHRFVKFKPTGVVSAISLPFYFHGKQIEFCAGLAVSPKDRRLFLSYGVRDKEAWVATVDLDQILGFLDVTSVI